MYCGLVISQIDTLDVFHNIPKNAGDLSTLDVDKHFLEFVLPVYHMLA